jgi:hypothetical protein
MKPIRFEASNKYITECVTVTYDTREYHIKAHFHDMELDPTIEIVNSLGNEMYDKKFKEEIMAAFTSLCESYKDAYPDGWTCSDCGREISAHLPEFPASLIDGTICKDCIE